jgi:hypothetical protein
LSNPFLEKVQATQSNLATKQEEDNRLATLIHAIENSADGTSKQLVATIKDLALTSLVSKDPAITRVVKDLATLLEQTAIKVQDLQNSGVDLSKESTEAIAKALSGLPDALKDADQSRQLIPYLQKLNQTVANKDTSVTVKPTIDLKPLEKYVSAIEKAVTGQGTSVDLTPLQAAITDVKSAIENQSFPVPNFVLPFKNANGAATQASVVTSTSDSTKIGIVALNPDGSNISGGSGGGGAGTQYADGTVRGTATGTLMMVDDGTNIQSAAGTAGGLLKVDLSGTSANSTAIKTDGSAVTQPVSAASLPLPSGAATSAKQPALGTAGSASSDVLTVQGIASMTALKVDGSAVTQPISAAALPLPSGAATETTLSGISTKLTDGTQKVIAAGDVASAATDTGNPIKVGTKYNATQPTFTDGQRGEFQINSRGELKVSITQATSSATVNTAADGATGTGGLVENARNQVYNGSTWDMARSATSAAGTTGTGLLGAGALGFDGTNYQRLKTDTGGVQYHASAANATVTGASISYQSALTNTKVAVKASAGNLYGYHIYNPNTSVVYIQIFNLASASVTLGTTTPTMVLVVPANGWLELMFPVPISFGTAITLAATTTASGSTAPSSTLIANFFYA